MLIDDVVAHLVMDTDESCQLMAQCLARSIVFNVTDVASYVHNLEGKRLIQDDIPNVAPLAHFMWFEYTGDGVGLSMHDRYGCSFSIDYIKDAWHASKWDVIPVPDDVAWIYRAVYWTFSVDEQAIGASDCVYLLCVRADGSMVGVTEIPNPICEHFGVDSDKSAQHMWHEEVVIALTAICFAHCKGVAITDHEQPRQQRRAAERSGKPPLVTYKTIDIAPVTRILHDQGQIEQNGIKKALHICRGHFAHYTEDAPLFGKYTGTYYKPMHIRGSAEKGVVVKDYNVRTTAR